MDSRGRNLGDFERIVRFVGGGALLAMALMGPQRVTIARHWGYVGAYPALTSILGFDPLYSFLKIGSAPSADLDWKAKGDMQHAGHDVRQAGRDFAHEASERGREMKDEAMREAKGGAQAAKGKAASMKRRVLG